MPDPLVKPDPSCRTCQRFRLADALLEPHFRALQLGHCALDLRRYAFKPLQASCASYVPTPARALWLSVHFPENANT